jgi:type VI secretion system protein ImpC
MDRTDVSFDLIVIAPFLPTGNAASPLEQRLHRLDAEGLVELLRRAEPALALPLPAGTSGTESGLTLRFGDFRSFRPEGIAAQIPRARAMLELRRRLAEPAAARSEELLAALRSIQDPPELSAAVRRALSPAPPAPPAARSAPPPTATPAPHAAGAGLDSLFEMVDVPAAGREPAPAGAEAVQALDRLLAELVGAARAPGGPTTAALKQIGVALEAAIGELVRPALHHPAFASLESAWLGLRFLVRRVDFRSGIRVYALSAPRARLLAALHDTVLPFAAAQREEGRAVCVLLDAAFGADELDELESLAREAEAAQVPLVASAAADLLGVPWLAEAERVGDLAELLDDEAHEGWHARRALDWARWVALGVNRFLLRAPYGAASDPVKEFGFEENPLGGEARYAWGNPCWALAALAASSFERTGWGVDMTGVGDGGAVGDLPVRPLTLRTGEVVQAPLEAMLSERRVLELSQGGLTALACRRNSDAAFVATAPTLYRPRRQDAASMSPAEARRASLPYQLMVAQIGAVLGQLRSSIDFAKAPDEIATTLAKGIEFLTLTREGPVLAASAEPASTGAAGRVALRISPRGGPLRGLPDLVLEVPLRAS